MSRQRSEIRFSLLFVVLAPLIAPQAAAQAYSVEAARGFLDAADDELASPSLENCTDADRFLAEADVHIDQVLRERTLDRNCTTRPLADLQQLAQRLAQLNRSLRAQCGTRRSYGNTLGKIEDWLSVPPCAPADHAQRCQEYANAAVRAQQRNIEKQCRYSGKHWHSDYAVHYNWCLGTSEWDAHQEAQGRRILLDNCDDPGRSCKRFIGNWNWFNGGGVEIKPDQSFKAAGNHGTWKCLASDQIEMHWVDGGWIDTLKISANGNDLSGSNQYGGPVSASRGLVASTTGMLYDVEQGSYGGGRLCLTADEVARIRDDPNTRRITEVGQPCSK